jgi:ABC-type nitrate/sulfonate/bicarbonate transport system permease component
MAGGNIIADEAQTRSSRSGQGSHSWPRWLDAAGLLGLTAAVAAWYAASAAMGPVLPMPHQVAGNALTNLLSSERLPGIGLPRGGYLPHLLYTARNVLLGGGIGAIVGVTTGLLSAENRSVSAALAPLVSLLGTTPIVIMAPFFLMWFGLSGVAQVALVAIYTATVLHLFAFRGARNLLPAFYDYAATLGAGPLTRFFRVRLPGSLPEIFGGLRIAMAAAWGLAAVTEMLGGQYGSGRLLVALRSVYDLTGIMAVVLLLGVLAVIADAGILSARAYLLRWASTRGGSSE